MGETFEEIDENLEARSWNSRTKSPTVRASFGTMFCWKWLLQAWYILGTVMLSS